MRSFRRAVIVGAALVATATAAGVVFAAQLVAGVPKAPAAARDRTASPPSAIEVADELVGVINSRSAAIGSAARIGHASCLQGEPGSYVCSYVRVTPPAGGVCSVAMLRWTPDAASTFTVETAGRVALAAAECGPVRKVLHVLGTSG